MTKNIRGAIRMHKRGQSVPWWMLENHSQDSLHYRIVGRTSYTKVFLKHWNFLKAQYRSDTRFYKHLLGDIRNQTL